ncbi:TraR/DksA C4-type zinc finger protein [Dactylosporangium sp. NBC_01737]|uniref:TraR/DksA family transcriptional regulator n=1 Tax=Dactylosporangium sp. NBC_01737 TaxID=2975959 RepID=UPI002E0F2711|nr:TraR/DksA C4-type zinc finger protein [Dactylosporangium sp. NBC_01737]
MTSTMQEPVELLRDRLERAFAVHTNRLTELTVRGPATDPATYEAQVESARHGVANTAQALRRMSEGSYGRCEACGTTIDWQRLVAVPHARRCSHCR